MKRMIIHNEIPAIVDNAMRQAIQDAYNAGYQAGYEDGCEAPEQPMVSAFALPECPHCGSGEVDLNVPNIGDGECHRCAGRFTVSWQPDGSPSVTPSPQT